MEKLKLTWEMVPKGWALCFNQECPLRDTCLRYQAGQLAPENMTVARCVMPRALSDGHCACFATMEPQVYAYGFSTIYDHVLKSDYTSLRKMMTNNLSGKRYYYEYMRGERALSPAQQDFIRQLFTGCGYGDSVVFDRLEPMFEFPWV